MDIPENYKGREQALVKHELLKAYLVKLFMIIGQHQKTICYVDCFAGPWGSQSEDLTDTSIGISLKLIKECRENLRNSGKVVKFRALYIEKDRNSFARLQHFLENRQSDGTETKALQGDFFDLRNNILEWCSPKDSFAFFFIDPKGWKNTVELPTLKPLLERPNSEFLINFMYDFLLRIHETEIHEEDMQAIFGEIPKTDGMSSKEREIYLVNLYRKNLKTIRPLADGAPRTVTVPVLRPAIDKTIYHLVYLTHHPLGIIKFMKASEEIVFVQNGVREFAKQNKRIERTCQPELFSAHELPKEEVSVDILPIKDYWLSKLTDKPKVFGNDELADMLEESSWFEKDLQKAFKALLDENKVINCSNLCSKRRTRFVHFDEKEKLKKA